MNKTSLEIGELVHIPAAVYLVKLDSSTPVVPRAALINPEPTLGVVTNIKHTDYVEVYCRGAKWAIPHKKLYKL